MSETAQNIDKQEQSISTLAAAEQKLIQSITNLATPEMEPAKAAVLPDLAKQVVKLFPDFQKIPSAADLNKIIPSTGRTVLQEVFAQLQSKQAIQFNKFLNPSHPEHIQYKGKVASFIETEIKRFDKLAAANKEETIIDINAAANKEGLKKDLTENKKVKSDIQKLQKKVSELTGAKGELDTRYSIPTLTPDEQSALAKSKFGKTTEQLDKEIKAGKYGKIKNEDGSDFGVSDFLAFVNTEEALADNPQAAQDKDFKAYQKSFSAMKKDLPKETVDTSYTADPIPAEKIGNMTTTQIQDNPNFDEYVQHSPIDANKTDYETKDLRSGLESEVSQFIDSSTQSDPFHQTELGIIGSNRNISAADHTELQDLQTPIEAFRDAHLSDIQAIHPEAPDDFTSLSFQHEKDALTYFKDLYANMDGDPKIQL